MYENNSLSCWIICYLFSLHLCDFISTKIYIEKISGAFWKWKPTRNFIPIIIFSYFIYTRRKDFIYSISNFWISWYITSMVDCNTGWWMFDSHMIKSEKIERVRKAFSRNDQITISQFFFHCKFSLTFFRKIFAFFSHLVRLNFVCSSWWGLVAETEGKKTYKVSWKIRELGWNRPK